MDRRPDLFAGGGGMSSALAAFVGEAQADAAADARSREAFLRRTAAEEGSFAGVLVDLAERGTPVLVAGAGGRRQRGTLAAVGADFVVLRDEDGEEVLLAHRGISSVTPEAGAAAVAGHRPVAVPVGLAEALAVLAEERPRVLLVTVGLDGGVAGELRTAGRDVLSVRLEGPDRRTAYVPLANVAEVRLA